MLLGELDGTHRPKIERIRKMEKCVKSSHNMQRKAILILINEWREGNVGGGGLKEKLTLIFLF